MNKTVDVLEERQSEKQYPTLFIELVEQGPSGFFQDDTIGTPTPIQVTAARRRFIPNVGYRRGKKIEIVNGKEKEVFYNERIRYIKNETEISYDMQRKLGIEPSALASEDKIIIERGYATIVREGATIGLYDYIWDVFFNESNPYRSPRATAIYRVLELDKQNQKFNDDELVAADAVKYVGTLYQKTGKNTYQYNEGRIDAICELLTVYADSYSAKIKALLLLAKQRPEWFINKVTKLEQVTVNEIVKAIELNIISLKDNVAAYMGKDKVIKAFGGERQLSREQMIDMLADFLRSQDGHAAYMELKAEIDAAQNRLLN